MTLSSGGDVAEHWQMLLALLQPIESRLPFPHTEYASLAGFILFKAPSEEILVSNGIMSRSVSSYRYAESLFYSIKKLELACKLSQPHFHHDSESW